MSKQRTQLTFEDFKDIKLGGGATEVLPAPNNGAARRRANAIEHFFKEINEWYLGSTVDFDPTFVEDLEDQFRQRGFLTDKQFDALQNIYENWVCN